LTQQLLEEVKKASCRRFRPYRYKPFAISFT